MQVLARPGDADPLSSSIAWGTVTFTAGYDSVGRITSFGNGSASTSFSYDANGNRLSSGWSEAGSSETRTYAVESGSNRLASVTQAATGPGGSASATIGYVYDANGALTFDGRNRYAYDAEGRLSSSAPATGEEAPVTRYAHNALGQRVFKTEPQYVQPQQSSEQSLWEQFLAFFGLRWAPQTQPNEQLGWAFVYDEEGTLLSEMGMGGPNSTGSTHHIWLPTPSGPMPIAAIVNGGKFAVHADHLNTPRRLTDESGQAVWQWAYSAFGDEEPTTAAHRFAHPSAGFTTSVPDVIYSLRYPGQFADSESALNYNYFRSYDPNGGGYIQPDPIGLKGGWNRIAYGRQNPLRFSDPFGLQTTVDAGIRNAIARGDVNELEALLEAANPGQTKTIQQAIEKFGSRASDWISKNCRGSINREFPSEFREKTLKEIMDDSRAGDSAAKKAWKLLNDNRFQK